MGFSLCQLFFSRPWIVTGRNEVVAKVIFLHLSVILFMGEGSASVHAGIPPPLGADPPCQGDPPAKETPKIPPPGPHPRGKLRGIKSRPTPKGEIEGDQIQAHTKGGNWGGSGPGPHPRGKFRGIRSRPTSKGDIQGDQDQSPRLRHMVNERPVRILLECILVQNEGRVCGPTFRLDT